SLVITHGGATTRIADASEMDKVVTALGLPPQSEQTTPAPRPKTPHVWDLAKVRPFQLARPTTPPSTAFKAQRANRHPTGT
ncbi:Hypothetical predicted protein, partial [Pelobates cultripes]